MSKVDLRFAARRIMTAGLAALAVSGMALAAPAAAAAQQASTSAAPSQAARLTAALSPEAAKATLTVTATSATLTLPATLLAGLQSEALKIGLGSAASRASASTVLSGQGYEITPNGQQSATLEAGKPAVFNWQIRPTAAAPGRLTAVVTVSLEGAGAPRSFALATLSADVPAPPAAAPVQASAPAKANILSKLPKEVAGVRLPDLSKLKLPDLKAFKLEQLRIPGHDMIDVPGVGPVASQKVVTGAILVLILLLLLAIGRNASVRRRRAAHRRRFRTFEATSFGDPMDPPADDGHSGHH